MKNLVIIESPYTGSTPEQIAENVEYARACMRDSLLRYNEYPLAGHLLYTQEGVLQDDLRRERRLGMKRFSLMLNS